MKISQKGLCALQAITMLARHYDGGAMKVRDIAQEEGLPAKFLELILIELNHVRILDSERGTRGGYKVRRRPADIRLSDIIRLMDGPLAPFGDADHYGL
jgi:Rrf2 family protein